MSVIRIASRYAKSLLDLAIEQDKLERVLEDIIAFEKATKNRDFYLLLKSPIINADKKQAIFDALFQENFDEMTMAFIRIILRKSRERNLVDIVKEFLVQYKKHKHISTLQLTTAVKLENGVVDKIKEKLLKSSETDTNIEIETNVDESLLGGFVIEFDDKLYDASVSHKLDQLKKEFSQNQYIKDI